MKRNVISSNLNKKWFYILSLVFLFSSCTKKDIPAFSDQYTSGKATPPPTPANSAIVFNADTTFTSRGQSQVVQAIFVMDADGSHRKMIYHDYVTSGTSWSLGSTKNPSWSGNGQKICFVGRVLTGTNPPIRPLSGYQSLYTLDFSLVSGVPTASNIVKILDGQVNSTDYREPRWSPVANEIVVIAAGASNQLQLVSSSGGLATTIYNGAAANITLGSPCFSPDGSMIAFHEKNNITGERSIRVIDKSTGTVLNSIALDNAYGWADLDWSRTPGSTVLVFRRTVPGTGQATIYRLDFSSSSTPQQVVNNASFPTWSPDDTQIAYSDVPTTLKTVKKLTLSNNNTTTLTTLGGIYLNWKR